MWVCSGVRKVVRGAEGHLMTGIIWAHEGERACQPDPATLAKFLKSMNIWERQVTRYCWRPRYKCEGGKVLMSRIEE